MCKNVTFEGCKVRDDCYAYKRLCKGSKLEDAFETILKLC
jgi:hypothetical protein